MNSQKASQTSPLRASYGTSFMSSLRKNTDMDNALYQSTDADCYNYTMASFYLSCRLYIYKYSTYISEGVICTSGAQNAL